ncbi:alpha-L-fucosidase [Neorhodopirellula lusitana]|uniref:alpha-L-fucosidase n=1 Tax=Neorhodopirellula lusitana TaxID=445327 RepID=A0ABY1QE52_9BACT|nr:alpha-L-fucosidase [Neorhodopirellula lusitana]SMP68918.1 alpha-L-fucosidase [Neorhodopirellula lusitana]
MKTTVIAGVLLLGMVHLLGATDGMATEPPAPLLPVPTERQLRWHELEYYGFVHFTTNTFTDKEWGFGDESPGVFNPTDCDADSMAKVAKESGMKGLIITAKHHDGFCLWPSRYTEHDLAASPYKNGAGDLVGEMAKGCRDNGILFGVYLSPWDRNHAQYASADYVRYYRNQLRELTTNYGPLFEVWFDGANGGDGFYGGANETRRIDAKTYYEWDKTWAIVRKEQPMAVMFSDRGPDVRWVGNESGSGSETNWAMLRDTDFESQKAKLKILSVGQIDGTLWVPAEVDVSIRPGWFYHADQDDQVKSLDQLLDIYYSSIGNGANLLLNVPPDRRGRFHETDIQRLKEFHQVIAKTFANDLAKEAVVSGSNTRGNDPRFTAANLTDGDRNTYWATDDGVTQAELEIDLGEAKSVDRLRIQEHVQLGQRIKEFAVDANIGNQWEEIATGTTIGVRRILRFDPVTTTGLRLRILDSRACPTISTFEAYRSPE